MKEEAPAFAGGIIDRESAFSGRRKKRGPVLHRPALERSVKATGNL